LTDSCDLLFELLDGLVAAETIEVAHTAAHAAMICDYCHFEFLRYYGDGDG
jgi:predicted HNH restriction endonuclease